MFLRTPKTTSKFENEHVYSIPPKDEIFFIAKTQQECHYYLAGISVCRNTLFEKQIKSDSDAQTLSFSKCKDVFDSYYRCTTHEKFGRTVDDADDEVKPYLKKFAECTFRDNVHLGYCRKYFDDVLRSYFRKADSPLKKVY